MQKIPITMTRGDTLAFKLTLTGMTAGAIFFSVRPDLNAPYVRASYCHLILDPDTEIRDNVHPTDGGYAKMALEVVNQINHWQNSD